MNIAQLGNLLVSGRKIGHYISDMESLNASTVCAPEFHATSACPRSGVTILLIGNDDGLQHSRCLLLERAGFSVTCLSSRQALEGACPFTSHLALICRSIGQQEAQWIAQMLHAAQPGLPILRFATGSEGTSKEFATILREAASPPALLAAVSRLLS